jgi:hypothetical protein
MIAKAIRRLDFQGFQNVTNVTECKKSRVTPVDPFVMGIGDPTQLVQVLSAAWHRPAHRGRPWPGIARRFPLFK